MPKFAYEISHPDKATSCVVFASPHSGRDYSARFLGMSVLDDHMIRSSEDAFVDQLFEDAPQFGASFLKAGAPRAFVDLNRSVDELDPALIEGTHKIGNNPRVASGLGVIPRVVANGRAIYHGKLPLAEATWRIEHFWRPYHEKLQQTLDAARTLHGQTVLIDCHSMPHEAMDSTSWNALKRPDVVLGDRFGASASGEVVDRIEVAFTAAGFTVARNAPFAGAYITQAYGRPSRRQHAVQVEIDRSIYMDEVRIEPRADFDATKARLREVIAEVTQIGQDRMPLAAE